MSVVTQVPGLATIVRPELPLDVPAVDDLLRSALGDAEAGLVAALRVDPSAWLPGLAVVAAADDLVGSVVLSRVVVGRRPALALAPLAVAAPYRGRGVGSVLVRYALEMAQTAGEQLVLVVGDPGYYRRFGFGPAARLGVRGPWGDGPTFQALALCPRAPQGDATYSEAFDLLR